MRVSHRNIYANMLNYMNHSLTGLVELNLKASSQKQINRPSDNPIGMARVLSYRDSLKSLDQYRKNVDTAQGWLGLADENLMQVSTIISRLKELAQQGATGTFSAENPTKASTSIPATRPTPRPSGRPCSARATMGASEARIFLISLAGLAVRYWSSSWRKVKSGMAP